MTLNDRIQAVYWKIPPTASEARLALRELEIEVGNAIASIADPSTRRCENCSSWTRNDGDPETGKCGSAAAHWHGASFNTFAMWNCRDWTAAPRLPHPAETAPEDPR